MDVSRRRWQRAWRRGLLIVLAALGSLMIPGTAFAADPPDVRGLGVAEATAALRNWDKSVVITFEPAQDALPPDLDPSTVVVSSSQWLNPTPIDTTAPQVLLRLGSVLPDLSGLSLAQAQQILRPRGLPATAQPAPADWVARQQRPLAGSIVPLGQPVTLFLVAPPGLATTSPPAPPPTPGVPPLALAGAAGGGLVVLLVLTTLVLRRARGRRSDPAAPAVEVRGFHGQLLGPSVSPAGPDLSIRVLGHVDAGTVRVEEVV